METPAAQTKARDARSSLPIKPSGFFALRTPLLPFDAFLAWGSELQATAALEDPGSLETALLADRATLRQRLFKIVSQAEVREALFVASPSLEESLEVWIKSPDSERGEKVERSLVRYFARLTSRSTPFGLFAGHSHGSIGNQTRLRVDPQRSYARHTRLDMDYLTVVLSELNRDPAIRDAILYRPNSSLYLAAQRFRYVESRLEDNVRSYHLSAVEPTEYLSSILQQAGGGILLSQLAKGLRDSDPELTDEEIGEYLQALVDNQILVSDLGLAVSGPEPIHSLISQLRAIPAGAKIAQTLDDVRSALEELDRAGLGNSSEKYRTIAKTLEVLPGKVELPHLFQVDMHKPTTEAAFGGAALNEIVRAIALLERITPRRSPRHFQQFREAFNKRYETREVPLVEVLDEESGIGFQASNAPSAEASPLLAGLGFPPVRDEEGTFTGRDLFLLNKVQEALRKGLDEIELQESDLKTLEAREPARLPDAFFVMATLLARSPEELALNHFRVAIKGVEGPSGANLLGRFCHGDPKLAELVRQHLRQEEVFRPDAIYAEVIHLPEGRVGNVLLRPTLREHEIPFMGRSGVPADKQIPVTDLLVSVVGERVRLRSARLGREVIPRMTNAHNYGFRSLGVYRFLCLLQREATEGMNWSWGALEQAAYLPRVVCGKSIFSRARWNLAETQLKPLGESDSAERFRAVQRLRKELRLPRLIEVADSDNTLLVDLDNVLSVETFVHLVKARRQARFQEFFAEEVCAEGVEGRFAHELIVPFVREQVEAKVTAPLDPRPVGRIQRSFAPGSEWLYCKLYSGTASADQVLREMVGPLVARATEIQAIDRWFFVRYADPDWHLRLRFQGHPDRLRSELLPLLEAKVAPLLEDGRVWRFQLDTYEREVERYGGPGGIGLAEKLFHADSEAALRILELLSGDEGAEARWRLACRGMDMLLDDLGFTLETKQTIALQLRQSYGREFKVAGGFEHQLGMKYRRERKSLEELLDGDKVDPSELAPGLAILRVRSKHLEATLAELKALDREGRLIAPLAHLASSYLHMHANRLLRSATRAQELVLYDFLNRTYQSRLARQRKAPIAAPSL